MKYDLHIHSKYSYDSFLKPETIIKIARKRGLDGVAVTDHNTIKGGLKTAQINNYDDFEVIIGSEIKTEFGDIVGLFLTSEIKTIFFKEVIDEIKDQNGISILAHPYRQYNSPEKLIEKIDAIEGFNARSTKKQNQLAVNLGKKFKKSIIGGSDSHSYLEIGKGYTILDSENLKESIEKKHVTSGGKEINYLLSHSLSYSNEIFKSIFSKIS